MKQSKSIYSAGLRHQALLRHHWTSLVQSGFIFSPLPSLNDFDEKQCVYISPLAARLMITPYSIYFDIGHLRTQIFETYYQCSRNGFVVRHMCMQKAGQRTVGLCINPKHFCLGTAWDNEQDTKSDREQLHRDGYTIPAPPAWTGESQVIPITYQTAYRIGDERSYNRRGNPFQLRFTLTGFGQPPQNLTSVSIEKWNDLYLESLKTTGGIKDSLLQEALELAAIKDHTLADRQACQLGYKMNLLLTFPLQRLLDHPSLWYPKPTCKLSQIEFYYQVCCGQANWKELPEVRQFLALPNRARPPKRARIQAE